MTQLFWKWTIKSHIEVLWWFDESKIAIVQNIYQDWKNWLLDDEVKYKEKFNQVFFWDLLWYENRTHRIPEWSIPGVGSADITLWNFTDGKYELENIQVACELKGAKSNLVKKQFGHGWLSPVGQGFAYKTALKNCKWLIVSNFYEIRLYRDNQTDLEVWNLDELVDPKDNYFNLRKLYLLLHRNTLLASTGKSKTEELLSHFREEQKEITAKFYKEYKWLRIDLINDMKQHNSWISIEVLIEKAQKIIDRLIFIFFCEDKGLLPDKKLSENILRSREAGFSPWEVTKKFFYLVDKGSEQLGIPDGYNGWLFQKDDVLDSLEIGDHICKKFVDLTNYDFDDKLSVNVLGHIFEQSISDLESLKIDLLGTEVETEQLAETGKGRRKKDGIFYTPEYIVDYIVQNSVMKYLNEKEDECLLKHKNKKDWEKLAYQEYQHILQNIKVLDPACGSWAFLVRVFDVLFEENKRVWSILNSLFDETETYKNILTNNIYGVDLNEESVEITKLSLWLKSAQKGKKLNNLDGNIKCWNSLIDNPEVAGEKAFDWNIEFEEIMNNWGFDVIVGNPPYVSTKAIRKNDRLFFRNKYSEILFSEMDLYEIFMYISLNKLLKENWYLSFITPNSFYTNKSFYKLRDFILEKTHIIEIVDFPYRFFPFDEVNTETTISIYNKKKNKDSFNTKTKIIDKKKTLANLSIIDGGFKKENSVPQKIFKEIFWGDIILWIDDIILKILLQKNELKKYIELHKWWMSIPTTTTTNNTKYNQWIFTNIDLNKDGELKKICNKYLEGRDIHRYYTDMVEKYVNILQIDQKTKQWHFSKKIILQRIVWQNKNKIFATLDTNNNIIFPNANIINIKEHWIDAKVFLSILNSNLINYFYNIYYWESNTNVTKDAIEWIPIPEISLKDQQPFVEKTDKMLSLNKNLHELTNKFLSTIQNNFKLEKITKKLENFYEWDFKDFLDELKKQKVVMLLTQQDERDPYFKEHKEKVLAVKGEIEKTDKEIDEMVFDLYGLSEEERRVVEGK